MHPRISVIMPCLNSERHILRALESVLTQTIDDLELLVIDNGSVDRTIAIVESIPDPRIRVFHQPERGVSHARNMGLQKARGSLIAFLDSDDTWSRNFLEKMTAVLSVRPEIVLAYCGWQNVGLSGPRGEPFVPPDYEVVDKKEKLLVGTRWPIHACVTKHEFVRAAGGFDIRFTVGEDFLLWLEIASFNPICLVPEVLAQYVHHDGVRATRDRVRAARQIRDVQSAFLLRHPEVIAELGGDKIRELTDGALLGRAFEAYWRRDLGTAQPIFRMALWGGGWKLTDLRYLLPSLLPAWMFKALVSLADVRNAADRS